MPLTETAPAFPSAAVSRNPKHTYRSLEKNMVNVQSEGGAV